MLGVAFLAAAAVLGVLAIQQATEISAYHNARACVAGAAPDAYCLRTVDGSVTAVTEFPGGDRIGANYALDVQTASRTLHLTFSSDSPMLGYAVDGNPAVVTIWRGVPVSVVTDGRSELTTSVPKTALARDLGNSEMSGGLGVCLILGAFAIRRNSAGGVQQPMRPRQAAAVLAIVLAGLVVMISGFALGGKSSRLGPDVTSTGGALVVVLGLSVWLGISAERRASDLQARLAQAQALTDHPVQPTPDLPAIKSPIVSTNPLTRAVRTPLRTRLHPINVGRLLGALVATYLPVLLSVGVLFGIMLTAQDGPPARAFRHAPTCIGETNLASCVGDFTAVINGVRTPANGRNSADVSYATSDGAINAWATFDGDTSALVRMAESAENAQTPLQVRVWHGSIIGAKLGGSWHWAQNNPPGVTIPAVFLAVCFGLLLFVVRLRIHRWVGSGARNQRLLTDDVGQAAAAGCSIVLLAYGFWAGAILALAVLLWLGLSARQSTRGKRRMLTSPHAA